MAQLQPFWYGERLEITKQTPETIKITGHPYLHGAAQNYKSIDCYGSDRGQPLKLKAPANCKVVGVSGSGTGKAFRVQIDNVKLQILFVHAAPIANGSFKQGSILGQSTHNHWHISGVIDGKYYDIREFFDRNTCKLSVGYDGVVQKDLNGNLILNQTYEMVTLPKPLQIRTTNTAKMELREQPNRNKDIGDVQPNSTFPVTVVASGEDYQGVSTWYQVNVEGVVGFINGKFVEILEDETKLHELQSSLDSANAKVNELSGKLTELSTNVNQLTADKATLEKENNRLANDNRHFQEANDSLTQKNSALEARVQTLETKLKNLENQLPPKPVEFNLFISIYEAIRGFLGRNR